MIFVSITTFIILAFSWIVQCTITCIYPPPPPPTTPPTPPPPTPTPTPTPPACNNITSNWIHVINTMVVDALVSCATRTTAVMLLSVGNVGILHLEWTATTCDTSMPRLWCKIQICFMFVQKNQHDKHWGLLPIQWWVGLLRQDIIRPWLVKNTISNTTLWWL